MLRYLFFSLFLLSGFAALVYEVTWSQYLKMILGHAAYAQALVLVVFMGGMSAGAWIMARRSERLSLPLTTYVLVEAGLGLAALFFHPAYLAVEGRYLALIEALAPGPALLFTIKTVASALLVLPQSVLLGATFPLLSAALVRRFPGRPGEMIANLYFNNSLGAAIGALVTGFVLIPRLGLPAALGSAGVINLLIAAAVAPFAWLELGRHGGAPVAESWRAGHERTAWVRWLAGAAFITGCASFLYEIAWIRLLSLVLGASTHAFELMLSAFILGLALGGFWIRRYVDRLRRPLLFLGGVQIAMGVLALLSFPMYSGAFYVMEFILRALARSNQGYELYQALSHGLALAIMLPATFFAGATLPLLTRLLLGHGGGERSIGVIYSANTIGAIVGVLLATFALIPYLGLKVTLIAGATLDVLLGLAFIWQQRESAPLVGRVTATALPALLVAAIVFYPQDPLLLNSQVFRRHAPGNLARSGFETLYYRDGRTATVWAGSNASGLRILKVNGKTDASMSTQDRPPGGDELTQILTGAIPLALQPQVQRALVIGFGSGQTTATLLTHPGLEQIDTVEIEQSVVEAGQYFRPTVDATFDDPRSHIWIEDGRSFMAQPGLPYDLIISEPSNPWVSGVAGLFTTEFYRQAVQRLAPGGLLVQWLQLYEMDFELLASVFNALAPHCEDFAAYDALGGNLLVVCAATPRELTPVADQLFDYPGMDAILERIGYRTLADFAVNRIASGRVLGPMFRELTPEVNSDFDPLLEYRAPRYHFFGSGVAELDALARAPIPLLSRLDPLFRGSPRGELTRSPYNPRALAIYEVNEWLRQILDEAPGQASELTEFLHSAECSAQTQALGDLLFQRTSQFDGAVDPQLIGAFWQRIEASPCVAGLAGEHRQWVQLLRTMNLRKFNEMGRLATDLLAAEGQVAQRYWPVVLGAAMLSHVAGGTPRTALSLYDQYGEELYLRRFPYVLALVGMAKEAVVSEAASETSAVDPK